jgi:hypothetical protein
MDDRLASLSIHDPLLLRLVKLVLRLHELWVLLPQPSHGLFVSLACLKLTASLAIPLLLRAAHHPQLWCEELHLDKVYLHVRTAKPSRRRVVDNPPRAGDHCSTSRWGSMGIDSQEQEGKAITFYN